MQNDKHKVFHKMANNCGQIAILIDPEKVTLDTTFDNLLRDIEAAGVNYIFVGGSTVTADQQSSCIQAIRKISKLPIVIFPGSPDQIDDRADAILFLNLISGRNPDYLIGYQVNSVPKLMRSGLEVIPTAYILVDGGKETMVQKVSQTKAIENHQGELALHTALAGVMMGNQLVYLDAGSGATNSVPYDWVENIRKEIQQPIVVGGGIRSTAQIQAYFEAGANLVVIGNHVESNPEFLKELAALNNSIR